MRAEIKQLMCDIVVYIAIAQDDVEMNWLVYEIKLGTSIVSVQLTVSSIFKCVYIKLLYYYKDMYVFSVFVDDCKLIFVYQIIYSLARTVCIHLY